MPYADHNYSLTGIEDKSCVRTTEFNEVPPVCENCADLLSQLKRRIWELENKLQQAEDRLVELEERKSQFNIEDIKHDNKLVEMYTGLQN